jgi:hypothetical protein
MVSKKISKEQESQKIEISLKIIKQGTTKTREKINFIITPKN